MTPSHGVLRKWLPEEESLKQSRQKMKALKGCWTDAESEQLLSTHSIFQFCVQFEGKNSIWSCQVTDGGRESSNHFSIQKL